MESEDEVSAVSTRVAGPRRSFYATRARLFVGSRPPETCITATIETVDDDRASSLLGVLPPS